MAMPDAAIDDPSDVINGTVLKRPTTGRPFEAHIDDEHVTLSPHAPEDPTDPERYTAQGLLYALKRGRYYLPDPDPDFQDALRTIRDTHSDQ